MTPSISEPRRSSYDPSPASSSPVSEVTSPSVALGDVERHHLVAERRLRLGEHAVVVGARLVELGDHHGPRHPDVGALAPQGEGPGVHAVVGRDHEQRAVGGPQARADVAHEVGVPGGVDEVDLGLAVHHGRDGEGDGAAVLALGLVEVADGGAVADGPGPGDGPRRGEQRLHQGGLAGASWPDEDHVADPVRAARPQILSGWSTCASLVGHGEHLSINVLGPRQLLLPAGFARRAGRK